MGVRGERNPLVSQAVSKYLKYWPLLANLRYLLCKRIVNIHTYFADNALQYCTIQFMSGSPNTLPTIQ